MGADVPRVSEIGLADLQHLGTGAAFLGTGGGGNPRTGRLRLRGILEDDAHPDSVEVMGPAELPADATVASVGGIGAPTIAVEKFAKGDEDLASLRAIERAAGASVDAIVPGEIGGVNSMAPLCVGALADLPVVDADGMGRAFPELQMDTFFIYGTPANYAAVTDEHGNQVVYQNVDTPKRLEDFARGITVDMGGRAGYAFPMMDGAFVAEYTVQHTLSLARDLGRRIYDARDRGADPVAAAADAVDGREFFAGKVADVFRRNRAGFARGEVTLAELDGPETLTIEFQNEFLVARDEDGTALVTVPDLVCIVDRNTGEPITTDALRYGQRVRVVAVPAPELLTTPAALAVVGPAAFGFDESYVPFGERLPPR